MSHGKAISYLPVSDLLRAYFSIDERDDERKIREKVTGKLLPMTWEFFEAYCDEAYAVISPDWATSEHKTPSGFALQQLEHDLAAIKGGQPVAP